MMNFDARTLHGLFVRQIADAQANPAKESKSLGIDGFVPVAVPCHQGVDASSNDITWTGGFVMMTRWLCATPPPLLSPLRTTE